MNAVERFAAFTPHGCSLIGGRGGMDRMTAQDIAAAAAMSELQEGPYLLALARGTDEPGAKGAWMRHWVQHVRFERPQWAQERAVKLALVTGVDALGPVRCGHCGGAGVHRNQRECARCGGSGVRVFSDADMARRLELAPIAWLNVWRARYRELMAVIDEWASDADWAIRRATS